MWTGIALGSLFAFFITLLSVPIEVSFSLDTAAQPRFRSRFIWLFGLVRKDIQKKEGKTGKKKRPGKRPDIRIMLRVLRTRGLFRQVRNLLVRLWRCLNFRRLEAEFTIGLGDPADTGLLFALIWPITTGMAGSISDHVRMRPSFNEAVFKGYASGTIRVSPIRLIPPLMRFIFSPATLRMIKAVIMSTWRRRK